MPEVKKNYKVSVAMEKHGKKTGKEIFKDIARRIAGPRKNLAKINLWKLDRLSKKNKGKIFVVPGFVLAKGELSGTLTVAALSFSRAAFEKIKKAKGKALTFEELAKSGEKTSSMVIVK